MDEKQISEIINRVFGGNPMAFEAALKRLALQADLVQINSKITNVQADADKSASGFVQLLDELLEMRKAKQAEIDALEGTKSG